MEEERTVRRTALWVAMAAMAWAGAPAAAAAEDVEALFRSEGAPTAPDDAAWEAAPGVELALSSQMIAPPVGGGASSAVEVRALHDGEWLALRLDWADATADRAVGVDRFRDAAAVGFPQADADTPPSPFMGDPQHPVSIWQWTADFDAAAAGDDATDARHPPTPGVWYFPDDEPVTRRVRGWRGREPVTEFKATGFGTLERTGVDEAEGASARRDDGWSVVLRRRLTPREADGPVFRAGGTTHVIVALWDGAEGEVNGRKSVTLFWTPLHLQAEAAGAPEPAAEEAEAPSAEVAHAHE